MAKNNLIIRYFHFIKNTFSGRIGRGDYFAGDILLTLAVFLIVFVFAVLASAIIPEVSKNVDEILIPVLIVAFMLVLNVGIIWLGLNVRRLHDFGYSGWALLLAFFPLLNIIVGLMALFKRGDPRVNEYGNIPDENKNLFKRILNLN